MIPCVSVIGPSLAPFATWPFIRWAVILAHGTGPCQSGYRHSNGRTMAEEQSPPRHQAGRAYARALEVVGYIVAIFGAVAGVATMAQVGFWAGLGYLIGAVASGIGLVVLGELVIVFFNIEYNTTFLRNVDWRSVRAQEEGASAGESNRNRESRPPTAH